MGNYQQPADVSLGDRFKPSEHIGALVLYSPTKVGTFTYKEEDGPKPVVHCDVDLIEGNGAPLHLDDVMVSNDLLYAALSTQIGTQVLGRLVKKGRAVVLDPHIDGDVAKADAYFAAKDASTAAPASADPVPAALAGLSPEQMAALAALAAQQKA